MAIVKGDRFKGRLAEQLFEMVRKKVNKFEGVIRQ